MGGHRRNGRLRGPAFIALKGSVVEKMGSGVTYPRQKVRQEVKGSKTPWTSPLTPTDPERAVFGSLEEGLIEIRGQQVAAFWNPGNSPLDWNSGWDVDRCAVPHFGF